MLPLGRDEAKVAALRLINSARKTLGKRHLNRLPKGIPGNPGECVLARGVGVPKVKVSYVGPRRWANTKGAGQLWVLRPGDPRDTSASRLFDGPVLQFVMDFDMGKYPELEDKD